MERRENGESFPTTLEDVEPAVRNGPSNNVTARHLNTRYAL